MYIIVKDKVIMQITQTDYKDRYKFVFDIVFYSYV